MAEDKKSSEDSFEIDSVGPAGAEGAAFGSTAKGEVSSEALRALNDELAKAKNDYLYLRADFDNYKKSAIKERADLVKYGAERMVLAVLDVLDNFERALKIKLTPETLNVYREGIELTAAELKKSLNNFGVTEVDCAGAPFDPVVHEALSSEETTEVPAGHISQVFKKAYKLHDRVIRPAQVVVAREPKKTPSDDGGAS